MFAIDRGAGERETFHGERGAVDARGQRFVVLEAVEFAGLEGARGHGGADDDLDDVRREANHVFDDGAQLGVETIDQRPQAQACVLPGGRARARPPDNLAWRWPSL